MIRAILLLAGFALCVPSAPAWAQLGSGENVELLKRIDTDGDGYVTRDEWNRFFADHDENRDGILSATEMQIQESSARRRQETDPGVEEVFNRLDANKDNLIVEAEWAGSPAYFRRIDANRDGLVSREEFRSRNARYWNEPFENVDTNKDNVITRAEWLDSDESFKKLDRDGNGLLNRREFYTRW
jgi:Ca2+-binding EF-hand superfamily protein